MRNRERRRWTGAAAGIVGLALAGCGGPTGGVAPGQLSAGYDPETGRLELIEYDADANGVVDHRTYMDGSRLLRIEIDADENGRIDRWEYYDDGNLEKVGYSRADDGIVDAWMFEGPDGLVERLELSTSRDERVDRWEFFEGGELIRIEQDTSGDGVVDHWETFVDGRLATAAFDENGNGRPDRRLTYDAAGALTAIESNPDESGAFTMTREVPPPPSGSRAEPPGA